MHNLLYVSHTSELGGAEHSLLVLLERLDRARFRPAVILPGDGPLARRLDRLGVQVRHAPMMRLGRTWNPIRLAAYWQAWRRAAREIARCADDFGADILHANSTTAHLFASKASPKRETAHVWHVRDFSQTGIWPIDAAMVRRAAAIIAISEAVKDGLRPARAAAPKATVIYNGVDTALSAPGGRTALRRELGIDDAAPVAGIVGQIVPWKGHGRFLEAAAIVAARIPEARFLVVGDNRFGDHPDLPGRLKDKARELGLERSALFLGWREDAVQVMNALDVLVVASDREPFGRVVIEAMACGRPVVSFRCGGPAEIIEHERTGLLVEPGNVSALADGIARLLSDRPTAAAMGRAAREAVCERFSADLYARNVQELYSRLLG